MVTYILCGIGVLVVLYVVMAFNRLSTRRNQIQNAISSLDSLFIQRAELIPNLIETTKQYMQYEQETLTQITELRSPTVTEKQNPYLQPEQGKKVLMNILNSRLIPSSYSYNVLFQTVKNKSRPVGAI